MPAFAARPMPTISAVGVASPSAQGHAITSTATAWMSACSSVPNAIQPPSVTSATTITAGTNTAETLSASCWTGAFDPWASATRRTIPASMVSRPTPVARQRRRPSPFTVAANTLAPARFATGMLSPVSIDSLALDSPSSTTPSTGMLSPGRTTNTSPGFTRSTGTSSTRPPASTRATLGWSRASERSASDVRAFARASSHFPSSTSAITTAPLSKYTS